MSSRTNQLARVVSYTLILMCTACSNGDKVRDPSEVAEDGGASINSDATPEPADPIGGRGDAGKGDAGSATTPGWAPPVPSGSRGPLAVMAQAPLTEATMLVQVLNARGEAASGVPVSAGGPAVVTDRNGLAFLKQVHGWNGMAQVYTLTPLPTQALVAVRDGETSHVVLFDRGTRWQPADVAAIETVERLPVPPPPPPTDAGMPDAGAPDAGTVAPEPEPPAPSPPMVALELAPESLHLPWDAPATPAPATGRASYALVRHTPETGAGFLPAGMSTRDENGASVPLEGYVAVDVRVFQHGVALALTMPAVVDVSTEDTNLAQATQLEGARAYWFDPARGEFSATDAEVTLDGDRLRWSIDRLGLWLVGTPADLSRCVEGRAVDGSGAPIAHASVRSVSAIRLLGAVARTDADGHYCLPGTANDRGEIHVLSDESAQRARYMTGSRAAAQCGGDCAVAVPLETTPHLGCVTGVVDAVPGARPQLRVASTSGEGGGSSTRKTVSPGERFCLPLGPDEELSVITYGHDCGDPIPAPTASAALCSRDSCHDVGHIACCTDLDQCGDAYDGDCDGMVDEGCSCGGMECVNDSQDQCCAGDRCGVRAPITDTCIGEYESVAGTCPDLQVPAPALPAGVSTLRGCCAEGSTCGVSHYIWGCLPREFVSEVYNDVDPLLPMACAP